MSHLNDLEERKRSRKLTPWKVWKMLFYSLLILFAGMVVLSTAITHGFGPYMGRVVDLETEEPIEGAAVLMTFYAKRIDETVYAGAEETLTDKNGEFKFSRNRLLVFLILSVWDTYGYVTIFKPGYGAYPDHRKALPRFEVGGTLPEKRYVTIKLPKLKTREERRRNLHGLGPGGNVPDRKMRNFLRLSSEEGVNLGFPALPAKRYGG